jgi:EAL domain-containing protein (putative c-di-GMP-specific phosphodiesterase class I)/ActR/RegA family two-component response regulator
MNNAHKPYVAILDDDTALCSIMSEVAEMGGFRTVTAADGSDLESLLESHPVLLILDLGMANVDGIEVIRQLAAIKYTGRLVLVSGLDLSILHAAKTLAEMQGLRVAGILTKPIRVHTLLAMLQTPEAQQPQAPTTPTIMLSDLARGIDNNELVLHYQPQVSLSDGAWTGVEALVRWQHPLHGLLYPDAFIALAGLGGLGLPLTHKVIEIALNDCTREAAALAFSGDLSINLPPAAMTDVTTPDALAAAVASSGCDKLNLMFEITESSVPPDAATALDVLTRLRIKGFRLSIDDFGTGHLSLEKLRPLPLSQIKIDLEFVRISETKLSARMIVENSIALGQKLGLKVLAEGIENEALWHWLSDAGCELGQGYFIAKPMPLAEIAAWKRNWDKKVTQLLTLPA